MKRICALVSCAALIGTVNADPGPRFAVGAVSDFVWRGISQTTNTRIAYQAEAEYEDARGFYAGAWASTVDGVVYPVAGDADLRSDFSLGVRAKTRAGLVWDLGVSAVRFDEGPLGFEEAYLGARFGQLFAKVAHDWDHDNTYTTTGVNMDLGSDILFNAHWGHYSGDTVDNYSDYGAGLGTLTQGWLLGLMVTDTDISPANDMNNTHTVLSIKKQW